MAEPPAEAASASPNAPVDCVKWGLSEDWLAVWIGLLIVTAGLLTLIGLDVFGWAAKPGVWTSLANSVKVNSPRYQQLGGLAALALTFLFVLVLMTVGARLLGRSPLRFALGFTIIFWISWGCWLLGHYAHIAATPNQREGFGIGWSMSLTGEAGFIIALLVGLAIGNFVPGVARLLKEAIRPEWYIKTAVVLLGAGIGVKFAGATGQGKQIMLRGFCAITEAYLIYWPIVYFVARRFFRFSREWAAPLASGISICGVSAAIATGGAIRSRPIVPVMVSSLVVIFAVMELIILPFAAQHWLYHEPLVAGAWMGLAVKTDGAAIASGAVADALVRAKAQQVTGVVYEPGWITTTATTVKLFIDVFIGVWAFLLAVIWSTVIDRREGDRVRIIEIWQRFPKFVIGYAVTFGLMLLLVKSWPTLQDSAKQMTGSIDVFRQLFFVLTFFTIGVVSNFRKLWEEGIGRLAVVYVVCLFGFIIWIGLFVSWLFFHGVMPPQVSS